MRLKKTITSLAVLALASSVSYAKNWSIKTPKGLLVFPESSMQHGNKNHAKTDLILFKPNATFDNGFPAGESPQSLACVYGLTTPVPGCNVHTVTEKPTGGWGAIALVDAFYNPYAANDLNEYIAMYGLAPADLTVYYAPTAAQAAAGTPVCSGTQPAQGWWDEQALDIEISHAMAPNAKQFLVEAQSFSTADMQVAINCATTLVAGAGGGIVSMSWSYDETPGEASFDATFTNGTPKVIYISSAGDYSAPARYPSTSPYVISAGGTSIQRDVNGNFVREIAWNRDPNSPPGSKSGGSGGPSLYEPRPAFQNVVQKIVGNMRGTPDISFNANPATGTAFYSTYSGGWFVSGGTSTSSPALAGIINAANHRAVSTTAELNYIYQYYPNAYHQYWHDIIDGNNGYPAMPGYDFATGLGTPRGYLGK